MAKTKPKSRSRPARAGRLRTWKVVADGAETVIEAATVEVSGAGALMIGKPGSVMFIAAGHWTRVEPIED